MATLTGDLVESVGVTELVGTNDWASASGTVGVLAQCNDPVRTRAAVVTEALGLTLTQSTLVGALLLEQVKLSVAQVINATSHVTLGDGVALRTVLSSAAFAALTETVGISLTQAQQQVVHLAEALGLTSALASAALYHQTLSEGVGLSAALARFLGADASDVIGLSSTLASSKLAQGILAETLGLTPTLTPRWLLHVELSDGIDVTADQVAAMIYSGVVEEGVQISAGFLSGAGDFTTWAINTRTGAASEYDNFVFNSFAQLGDRYIGANSNGIYWLDGDDDDGTDIIARLKGGLLQFGGTHLSRLKAAYIATRGETDFVLRIETGEGVIYDYAVSTRSMRSTKVHMGKGQRARYFSFELISTGADFDLDSLEFVPIVVGRRV